jgi:site-specific DNA recombinase
MKQKASARKVIPLYPLPDTRSAENSDEPPKKRVAAYCRVSSGSEEQLHSVKAQIDYYKQYISSNPDYEFAGIYADEGISGTGTLRREAFNRLMADCRAGLVDMVITKSVSRFGRNTVDTLKAVRELKNLNVDVFFEKEGIHTMNSEGEVLLTLISAVAQNEALNLSENVKWGIRRKYESGSVKSVPCGKFLGYDKIDGKLVINEEQAIIIRRIYQEFLDGYSFAQIAAHLTADGIPSQQGNAVWNLSSVQQILKNEKFKGDTLFQKTYNTDHLTKKRADNNGELPQYYIEGSHPAIIGRDIWECVQLEFARQERYCKDHHIGKYHNHNEEHPLSARITCRTCGCTFMLQTSKRVGEDGRQYWKCSSFKGHYDTPIEDRTFTPPPMAMWSMAPDSPAARYRNKHRKLPAERQMLCTDIQVSADAPEKAFVKAWNQIVSHRLRYIASFQRIASASSDLLVRYRANEMIRLISEVGRIEAFDYVLALRVLDHIEVTPDGRLTVIFLSGTKITC